jgi:hypothetical protein
MNQAIRTDDKGYSAFEAVHEFYQKNCGAFSRWLDTAEAECKRATRAAAGVSSSQAAIWVIESGISRKLGGAEAAAAAWIVNVCIDLEQHVRGQDPRTGWAIIADNGKAVALNTALREHLNIGPHAAAQIGLVLTHLETQHVNPGSGNR